MKPIIYIPKGNFEISGDELKALIDRVYDQGYEDGRKVTPPIIYPNTTPVFPYQWTTTTADATTTQSGTF